MIIVQYWVDDNRTALKTVFKNSMMTKHDNFMDIRRRLYDSK